MPVGAGQEMASSYSSLLTGQVTKPVKGEASVQWATVSHIHSEKRGRNAELVKRQVLRPGVSQEGSGQLIS